MIIKRYLVDNIKQDIQKKMVFLAGPRQVGKTTLAKSLITSEKSYMNWDIPGDRDRILKREIPTTKMIIYDEIHKYKQWRNYLKGVFDEMAQQKKILVTGSARLDYYRKGGDSLQGRYFFHRLHPFSFSELGMKNAKDLNTLLTLGGFPEPFLGQSQKEAKRWSVDYRSRLIQDDLNTLEMIQDLGQIELLLIRLPNLVGSPLSLNSIREDLQVSHHTVRRWLDILERLYAIFRLPPFGGPQIRAVKKEQKHYHYDWTLVQDKSLRFENLVAGHLLKWVSYKRDTEGETLELRYFRDIDRREVDFVITDEMGIPKQFVECKWNDGPVSPHLKYLQKKFPGTQCFQISAIGKKDYETVEGIRVCSAVKYLSTLV